VIFLSEGFFYFFPEVNGHFFEELGGGFLSCFYFGIDFIDKDENLWLINSKFLVKSRL
jgi:hypothetical protein